MIEKAKLILSRIWEWGKTKATTRFRIVIFCLVIVLPVCLIILSKLSSPSYEPDGMVAFHTEPCTVTDNTSLNLQTDYDYLQRGYEALALDYDKIRNTLISTIAKLETSDQLALAYKDAYDKLLVSYQAMSVAKQLLEAGNTDLSQTSNVSKEFSQQYEALVILHKEKSEQYEDLLYKIDEVSDKLFFAVTDNFTQADMDSFYIGWDKWIESLEEEE